MDFWRKEPPVIDQNTQNVLKGGMLPPQRQWWESKSFIKALIAGYGAGKTFIAAKRGISLALENSPAPHLMVSPSYKMARRTLVPALNALLSGKQTLHPDLKYRYHKTDHEMTIWYHGRIGRIWIASGDDPEALKGPNVGSAHIDEPFIQDVDVLDQVLARVRDPNAKIKEIGMSGTPEQLNWGYDICEGEKAADYDVEVTRANTRENVTLDPSYYDRLLAALTPEAARAYLGGEFINLMKGRIYYGMHEDNFVELPDPGHELGVGMDFNVNPMAAVVFWRSGNHMHFIREIELPNADTEYMCAVLKENFRNAEGECRIHAVYPDASGRARSTKSPGGKSDFHFIKQAGFTIDAPTANPLIRDRENAVNGKLNPKAGPPTLTFDPSMKKMKAYMAKYNHEERNKPAMRAMSHLLDAVGYPVHRLFPVHMDIAIVKQLSGY